MKWNLMLVVHCMTNCIILVESKDGFFQGNDYCQLEFFNPRCSSDQVIFIESAKYGRMSLGRCIKEQELESIGTLSDDPKFFGCYSDVTSLLRKRCSFLQECKIEVKDIELNHSTTCYSWAKLHLLVTHQCLDVVQNEDTNCRIMASERATHLIIDSSGQSKCGDRDHPWLIEAYKSQTIKITQLSFVPRDSQIPMICSGIGVIISERRANSNVTVCQESHHGKSVGPLHENKIYKSKGGILEIFKFVSVDELQTENNEVKLLLRIEADGCMDIIPPEDTWLKRTSDDIVIGCYSSKQTWYLRCENGRWSGNVGNCSRRDVDSKEDRHDDTVQKSEVLMMSEENQILVIFAIVAFGIVVCLLIICCGLLLVKKFRDGSKFNPALLENCYQKENPSCHSHSGPYSYATAANKSIPIDGDIGDKVDGNSEDKYYILEE